MTNIRNDIFLYGRLAAVRMRVAYIINWFVPGRYRWPELVFWALLGDEFPSKEERA